MKLLVPVVLLLLHPVHVSLTGIAYDGKSGFYSVFVKVYSDDLESDLRLGSSNGKSFDEGEGKYAEYLSDKLKIIEDGKELKLKLRGYETEGAEHRFTLEARGRHNAGSITVVNRIMSRLYDDMANMLMFSGDGIEEGYKFTPSDTLRTYKVK